MRFDRERKDVFDLRLWVEYEEIYAHLNKKFQMLAKSMIGECGMENDSENESSSLWRDEKVIGLIME